MGALSKDLGILSWHSGIREVLLRDSKELERVWKDLKPFSSRWIRCESRDKVDRQEEDNNLGVQGSQLATSRHVESRRG